MNSSEVFYVHLQGVQRGPYTIPQIDHMLNSGLIELETLYWREGMEQWQPVTELVVVREVKSRWGRTLVMGAVALILGVLAWVFGPITLEGWRETNQRSFTEEGAYWRARDAVRTQGMPKGGTVIFEGQRSASVVLEAPRRARVTLTGEVQMSGGAARRVIWAVRLIFDPKEASWFGEEVKEVS